MNGGVLSDRDLKRIYPNAKPGPASIDLTLGDSLLYWPTWVRRNPRIDQSGIWKPSYLLDIDGDPYWVLQPGIRYLAAISEEVTVPLRFAAQIEARSSWGRDGLSVTCGPAGWIDPGYRGKPTLEIHVVGSELIIWPGADVAQMIVHTLTSACRQGYRGKYQGDTAPTPSRLHLDAEVPA